MPITIVNADITTQCSDVIVNPTDCSYSGAGGVDYQIHAAAGSGMDEICGTLPPLTTGGVRETPGFLLGCKYVIHTVGPVWRGGGENEAQLLRSCYINSLMLAVRLNARSVSFPLISSGTFGFPKDKVMRLAVQAVSDFLRVNDSDLDVYICVIDRNAYEPGISQGLRHRLDAAVRRQNREIRAQQDFKSINACYSACLDTDIRPVESAMPDVGEWLKKHDDTFAVTLLKLIDKKGMTEVQCYRKANVSRKTFSKINTDKDYRPSKQTVIAFAIALELDLNETEQLLKTVGFSLSHSNTFDLIIEFCIRQQIYDVMEINEILYKYDQVCLG